MVLLCFHVPYICQVCVMLMHCTVITYTVFSITDEVDKCFGSCCLVNGQIKIKILSGEALSFLYSIYQVLSSSSSSASCSPVSNDFRNMYKLRGTCFAASSLLNPVQLLICVSCLMSAQCDSLPSYLLIASVRLLLCNPC